MFSGISGKFFHLYFLSMFIILQIMCQKKNVVESNKGTHNTSRTALIESISGGSCEDSN